MNFVYISPAFPKNYYQFCDRLKTLGVQVLGIGDMPYDSLDKNVKRSLTEYYYVPTLENYDDLTKAMGYYIFHYGRIDYIASNIEYWLETEARLRTDFNIRSGMNSNNIDEVKLKSVMKDIFEKYDLPCVPYIKVTTYKKAKAFVRHWHYPVIIKPDNGKGVHHVHKIDNNEQLSAFFSEVHDYSYIMEPFVEGETLTYDGIANDHREVLFETEMNYPRSLMTIVNENEDSVIVVPPRVSDDLKNLGRLIVSVFPSENCCFHIEFFRLTKDMPGIGKANDLLIDEVNMRLPGGHISDLLGRFHATDLYAAYAQMIVYGITSQKLQRNAYGVVVGRRRGYNYQMSVPQLRNQYTHDLVMVDSVPAIFSDTLGDVSLAAKFKAKKEVQQFIDNCTGRRKNESTIF